MLIFIAGTIHANHEHYGFVKYYNQNNILYLNKKLLIPQ